MPISDVAPYPGRGDWRPRTINERFYSRILDRRRARYGVYVAPAVGEQATDITKNIDPHLISVQVTLRTSDQADA